MYVEQMFADPLQHSRPEKERMGGEERTGDSLPTAAATLRNGDAVAGEATRPRARSASASFSGEAWRSATTLSFFAPDVVACVLIWGVLGQVASVWELALPPGTVFVPGAVLLIGGFAVTGLYRRALTMHPAQELRRTGVVTAVVALAYGTSLVLAEAAPPHALAWLSGGGVLAVLVFPATRALSRILFSRTEWWGAPVVVVGSGRSGRAVVRTLQRWPEIGLRPVAFMQPMEFAGERDAYGSKREVNVAGDGWSAGGSSDVPELEFQEALSRIPEFIAERGISYVVLSLPQLEHRELANVLRRCSQHCEEVFVVPDVDVPAVWTSHRAFEGLLGYSVKDTSRRWATRLGKRLFDVIGALMVLVLLAPLLVTIAVLIKLGSQGPVLFRQLRIGRRGRCFSVLKFRTMHVDAEEKLEALLEEDPERRAEYRAFHKLRDDPRVTRLGAFLRGSSLDELPQLWNVLRGHMSLVGPRAYTPGELADMGGLDRVILQCRPGLTGLWQVSGRNALSFEERTHMDVHYVHHRTRWLDLYILARTLPAVLGREGVT